MNQYQYQMPKLSQTNKVIIILTVCLFILDSIGKKFLGFNLSSIFGLSIHQVLKGYIHQVFTYCFIEHSLFGVLFNGILLWFIGSELEVLWGKVQYAQFLLASSLGGSIIFLLISVLFIGTSSALSIFPLIGLTGVCSALCLAYAIIYPERLFSIMFLFPIKAKYFCLIIIGMEFYRGFFSPAGILSWGHLGTMLSAYLFMLYRANKKIILRKNRLRKSRLKIVKTQESESKVPPKYWQ